MTEGWLLLALLAAIAVAFVWLSSYGERYGQAPRTSALRDDQRLSIQIDWEEFAAQQAKKWQPVEPAYPPGAPGVTVPTKDREFKWPSPSDGISASDRDNQIDALTNAWAADLACTIKYRDAADAISVRRISVNGLARKYGQLYLSCFCHERRAPRSFRVDRIIDAWDSRTGEIIDIAAWAEEIASAAAVEVAQEAAARNGSAVKPTSGGRTPYGRCADGLRVLRFLAAVDNHEHRDEMKVIEAYVRVMCDGAAVGLPSVRVDAATQARWISRQNPTPATFMASARKVFADSSEHAALVLDCALRVIEADGAVSAEERDSYDRLLAMRDRINARAQAA